jgi:histidine triad (HIT) family protein
MADGCVFCAIVAGTAPAERVYEDASVIAIMDIHPATTGHVLVIPKHHSPDLWHIPSADAERAMAASVQVAAMIRRALGPDGINLVHATGRAAWQTVSHFHLHLVPRREGDHLVPPWPLGQPRAEGNSLRVVADKIRAAGWTGGSVTPQLGDRTP